MLPVDAEMQTDWSDAQNSNAESPRSEILEPGSNVKVERFRQPRKSSLEIVAIDEGRQIEGSEQPSNADTPRVESRQPGANVTFESSGHKAKQLLVRISIDEGK
jgi:hypothetical protein